MPRSVLIGIDGADPDLVDEFDLPNIRSIGEPFEINTYGNSGPSWASVITGRKPKHHGIDKIRPQQTSQSWTGIPIWQKVDGYSGVANVPLTYPPDDTMRGWLVSSFMTPKNAIYTYPRDLYKELDSLGYEIDMWVEDHQNHPHGHYGTVPFEFSEEYRDHLLEQLDTVVRKRGEAFDWLLRNEPVDFNFLCFTCLDRVQHLAFEKKDVVENFYTLVDEQVGRILDLLDGDTEIFMTSDHGFQRIDNPDSNLTGDHRLLGVGSTNTGRQFENLLELHELVVESANRNDEVEKRLADLGYLD